MGFFGAMGKALKAPLKPINKAVGAVPGMKKLGGAMNAALPGGNKLGIGPTPNPSGGMGGKFAAMGQMNRPPQALPALPPMQQDQMQLPSGPPQPMGPPMASQLPFQPDMGDMNPQVQPPMDMGGMMPIPQAPPQQQMNPKQSMFMDRMRGKAARRMM